MKHLIKIGILLFTSPVHDENSHTVVEFTKAALKKGHEVQIYCLGDGVYSTLKSAIRDDLETANKQLAALSIQIINCKGCADYRGVTEELLTSNAENSGLVDLVDIMLNVDRFLAFIM